MISTTSIVHKCSEFWPLLHARAPWAGWAVLSSRWQGAAGSCELETPRSRDDGALSVPPEHWPCARPVAHDDPHSQKRVCRRIWPNRFLNSIHTMRSGWPWVPLIWCRLQGQQGRAFYARGSPMPCNQGRSSPRCIGRVKLHLRPGLMHWSQRPAIRYRANPKARPAWCRFSDSLHQDRRCAHTYARHRGQALTDFALTMPGVDFSVEPGNLTLQTVNLPN